MEKIEKILNDMSDKELIALTRRMKKIGKTKKLDLERNALNQEQDDLLEKLNGNPKECP